MFNLFHLIKKPSRQLSVCPCPKYFQGQAIVKQEITPYRKGRVYFKATSWFARCEQNLTIPSGAIVEVIGNDCITLIVRPYSTL